MISSDFVEMGYKDLIADFLSVAPKEVDGVMNMSSEYYRRWMLKKLFGIFEFGGVPDSWDMDYVFTNLFLDGKFCITDTDLGVLPLQCGVTGYNVFNHPSEVQIANPVLGTLRRTIDVDCALVKLQYTYDGVGYMLNRFATLLAMCDSAISVNLMNSKVAFIARAQSKQQANTFKKMYDTISKGEPFVVVNADTVQEDMIFYNHVKQNFVADEIQIVKRKIINEFLTEIGINNANMDKRERLVADEVAANDDEVKTNVQHWIDNIREGLAAANRLYNMQLTVRLREQLQNEEIQKGDDDESDKLD